MYSCNHWLRPRNSPRNWAHIRRRYWSAKIDDLSFCNPLLSGIGIGRGGERPKIRQTTYNIREPERQHNPCCQLADCSAALFKMGLIKSRAAGRICGRISAIFVQKGPKRAEFLHDFLLLFSEILCNKRNIILLRGTWAGHRS